MAISTAPPPATPKKKSGCSCVGCGCAILLLIFLLIVGLLGGLGYFGYQKTLALTTPQAADIPGSTGGDEIFNTAQMKISAFNHDVSTHAPSSLKLNSDEINAIIAHNPDFTQNNVHLYVILSGSDARLQGSVPTDVIPVMQGFIKGRFLNFDTTFSVGFDAPTHHVELTPHAIQVGDQAFFGPDSASAQNPAVNRAFLESLVPSFNESFNQGLRKNPGVASVLDQAKSIEVKDGVLDIETL